MKKIFIVLGIITVAFIVILTVKYDEQRRELSEEITVINEYMDTQNYIHIELAKEYMKEIPSETKYTEYTEITIDIESNYLYFKEYIDTSGNLTDVTITEIFIIKEELGELVQYFILDANSEKNVLATDTDISEAFQETVLEYTLDLYTLGLYTPNKGSVSNFQSADVYQLHVNRFNVGKLSSQMYLSFNEAKTKNIDILYTFKNTSYTYEIVFNLYNIYFRKEVKDYTLINYKEKVNFPLTIEYEIIS